VSDFLGQEGISGFVAHSNIKPSKKWKDTIEQALGSCHAMATF
jgi:hypothetical protein